MPIFINEIMFFLNQPIPIKFYNPLSQDLIDDYNTPISFNYIGLLFYKHNYYSKYKQKKFRFLKRKIKRRLILQNNIID